MLATFLIEIAFAAYVLWRYKMTTVTRLVVTILVCLAAFQGTEYLLCGGAGVSGGTWSRLGYSAITLLPPLGLHLAYAIAGKQSKYLVPFAYVTAGLFVAYFAFGVQAIAGHTCYANYAVFDTRTGGSSLWFGLYYYTWLGAGVYSAWKWGSQHKGKQRTALYALALGYLAFILPTATVNLIDPTTISGIPSIMCGFAVILAFILVGKVAPNVIAQKNSRSLWLKWPL